jgi:hypothetical protein
MKYTIYSELQVFKAGNNIAIDYQEDSISQLIKAYK